jgi:hypothetical protein
VRGSPVGVLRATGAAIVLGLLLGCGGITGPGSTITVTGTVFDLNLEPQAGASVMVNAMAPVTTDASGQFSVSGVKTPYQIVVALVSAGAAAVYMDLTRADPSLLVPVGHLRGAGVHYATVSGTVSGGAGYPEPANHKSTVLFESPEAAWTWFLDASTGAYQMSPQWNGPATTTGTIHALQWQFDPTTNVPTAYTGYGTRPNVVLADGGALTGQDIALGSVTTGSLNGTITVPGGYTLVSKTVSAVFPTSSMAEWTLFTDNTSDAAVAYVTPRLAGTSLTLEADALAGDAQASATKTGLSADASGIAVSVPAAPVLGGLPDGATGVSAGARLSWSRMNGAIYLVQVAPSSGTSGGQPASYLIFTADTTVGIPDLGSLGLGLARGTSYDWVVTGIAPVASLDDVTKTANFMPVGDWSNGTSVARYFATVP